MRAMNPKQLYIETVGNPALRSLWAGRLMEVYEQAERNGKLSSGYKKFLMACMSAVGIDFDFDPHFDIPPGDPEPKRE